MFIVLINYYVILITIIDNFRQHMRLKKTQKNKKISHFIFAANDDNNKFLFKKKLQISKTCVCELIYWFFECFYFNKSIKNSNWKFNSTIQIKIDEILKKNSKKKVVIKKLLTKNVEYIIKFTKKIAEKQKNNIVEIFTIIIWKFVNEQYNNVKIFFVNSTTFYNNNEYYLRFFWIMNYNFDIHVVNKTIKNRFIKNKNCIDNFIIISNNKLFSIKTYKYININVYILINSRTITLLKIYYVSKFIINIIFENILKNKKVYFDI